MEDAIYFSASSMGFYTRAVHGEAVPDDAVRISHLRHAELLSAQANGRTIAIGQGGKPVIAPAPKDTIENLRTRAVNRIGDEARRRILGVASLEQQSNDNALMAIAALDGNAQDAAMARARRRSIDALRTRSNELVALVGRMTRGALEAFNPSHDDHWS